MQPVNYRYWLSGVALWATMSAAGAMGWAAEPAAVTRVGDDIRFLASDELEGRAPGTEGLQKAADYIRDRFESLGLKGGNKDGSFFRPFEIPIDQKIDAEKTRLVLRGPGGKEIKLQMGKDFQPLATGGSGQAKAEVVFAGYGISAPDFKYDDFADVDVEGKVLVIIRREPQQGDDKSAFDGKAVTQHSYIRTKLQLARRKKAAAVLMVNDPFTTASKKKDDLTPPNGFGTGRQRMPFAHVKQSIADQLLAAAPVKAGDARLTTVAAIGDHIDKAFQPVTQPLTGWTAELEFRFASQKVEVSNVIGVLEGEGPLADETIVIGAHYDHLGFGPFGSRKPAVREVHNGADDNATGTAAVMELARRFAKRDKKPSRRLVFMGFTAEERGIIGSNYYLEKPLFPLEKTVAMINFDMIGHMQKNGLQVGGAQSAKEFGKLIEKVAAEGKVKIKPSRSLGGSDHAGFYRKGVPVLFFFTGLTDLYHTPEDDFETINVPGAVQAIDVAEKMIDGVLDMEKRPEYVRRQPNRQPGRGAMAYFGVVPDYGSDDGKGLRLTDVAPDGPAAAGGLKKGDVVIKIGDVDVPDIQGLANGLRKYKAGQQVEVVVRRGDEKKTFKVKLGAPRGGN